MLHLIATEARSPILAGIYRRMPERMQRTEVWVIELKDSYLLDLAGADGINMSNQILISNNEEEGLTFIHEVSHSAWFETASSAERHRWRQVWRTQLRHIPDTGGARGNPVEGFAECASYYYRSPSTRKKLNAALQHAIHDFFEAAP